MSQADNDWGNPPERCVVSVGGMIFNANNQFLLVHPTGHKSTDWRLPKGEIEDGESETETVLREVQEETGFACSIIERIPQTVSYPTTSPSEKWKGKQIVKTLKMFIMVVCSRNGTGDWENDQEIWVDESNYEQHLLPREIPIAEAGLELWKTINGVFQNRN